MSEFASARTRSLQAGLGALETVPFQAKDRPLRDLVHDNLASALAIYRDVLGLPASTPRLTAESLMVSAQRLVIQSAVALINYGAKQCAPPADERPAAPGRDGGALVAVAPTAVINVGAPGLDNKSIVVDGSGAWVALAREPSLVRIDRTSNVIVARVALPSAVTQPIQAVDGHIWVATTTEMDRIDEATNHIDFRMDLGQLGPPDSAFTVNGGVLWACDAETLHRFDVADNRPLSDVFLPGACQVLTATGDHVTVAYGVLTGPSFAMFVARINAETGGIEASVALPGLRSAWGMLETPSGRVFIDSGGKLEEVDVMHKRVVRTYARSGRPGNELALVGVTLWLTRQDEQRLVAYDLERGWLAEVTGGPGVNGVAYFDGSIWATNSDAGTVVRYPANLAAGS